MRAKPTQMRRGQLELAWHHSYFAAVLETNQGRALTKIERAHKDIQERVIELRCRPMPNQAREMQDLNNALTYLRILLEHIGREGKSMLWE